ncbi:PcfK-like family protein [Prevotella merdae]|uniref:PcfK-like family protein n=1 Tax=Prevotella merdae TaxID=2079531 RepID=UPI003569242E
MKATEHFRQTIKAYLDERAQNDELFAVSYAKENKNLDDCVTFILNQVKRSKCMGLTDEEVYSLAVHFFDEDDIEIGNSIACNVIVNHTVELTEEEKAQARQDALKEYQAEQLRKMQKRTNKPKTPKAQPEITTPSLFDF